MNSPADPATNRPSPVTSDDNPDRPGARRVAIRAHSWVRVAELLCQYLPAA